MDKVEIGAHLFFLGSVVVVVFLGALWSAELAYRVAKFVV